MPKIARAILALITLIYVGILILCGSHPQGISGENSLTAVAFAGMTAAERDLITVTIKRFIEISGLSNTTVYGLLNRGELESVSVGRRRLILMASYWRLLGRQQGAPVDKPVARPPLPTRDRKASRSALAG
jgi:hypothetical protein